jgi:hypothetical protein
MDRPIIYPGQIPLETDLLSTNRNTMVALSKLAAAILGTSTLVNGLACTPTSPASMNIQVGAGEIYALQNLDGTAYSSLVADTTHQLLKQGIRLDAIDISCPAPATVDHSINYLIQATFNEVDNTPVVLPYYNASNPAQAYAGPDNSGTAQFTNRAGAVIVSAKAGISATTGTQTTPAPDAGYVGLWIVTVANGQTTITASNIIAAPNAPFISETLTEKVGKVSGIATQTEVNNPDPATQNDAKFVTSKKLWGWVKQATESILGMAKVATQVQVDAGTDDTTIVTPKKLRWGFAISLAVNGYIVFPSWLGGLILQWGTATVAATGPTLVTRPIAFPNAVLSEFATDTTSAGGAVPVGVVSASSTLTQIALTGNGTNTPGTTNWLSIGH